MELFYKMDAILEYLAIPENRNHFNKFIDVEVFVYKKYPPNELRDQAGELGVMATELLENKYITALLPTLVEEYGIEANLFMITFKGLLLLEKGGYVGRHLENSRAERRVRISQILTWILTVGVMPPFWWYSLDVAKNHYPNYLNYLRDYFLPYGTALFLLWLLYITLIKHLLKLILRLFP